MCIFQCQISFVDWVNDEPTTDSSEEDTAHGNDYLDQKKVQANLPI